MRNQRGVTSTTEYGFFIEITGQASLKSIFNFVPRMLVSLLIDSLILL